MSPMLAKLVGDKRVPIGFLEVPNRLMSSMALFLFLDKLYLLLGLCVSMESIRSLVKTDALFSFKGKAENLRVLKVTLRLSSLFRTSFDLAGENIYWGGNT